MRGTADRLVCDHCTRKIPKQRRVLAIEVSRLLIGTDVHSGGLWGTYGSSYSSTRHFCTEKCGIAWFAHLARQALRMARRQIRRNRRAAKAKGR